MYLYTKYVIILSENDVTIPQNTHTHLLYKRTQSRFYYFLYSKYQQSLQRKISMDLRIFVIMEANVHK